VRAKPIEEAARIFFAELFSTQPEHVKLGWKDRGVQFGSTIHVATANGTETFFFKTHTLGLKDLYEYYPPPLQPVDPRELLVYKLLELIGVGC
jgi:hypothetical protein